MDNNRVLAGSVLGFVLGAIIGSVIDGQLSDPTGPGAEFYGVGGLTFGALVDACVGALIGAIMGRLDVPWYEGVLIAMLIVVVVSGLVWALIAFNAPSSADKTKKHIPINVTETINRPLFSTPKPLIVVRQ